jgi:PAT family beta-lactamase induction signal transducer AmpG
MSSIETQAIFNRRMLICVFTGLASGMPLYVLFQLVPAWLRDEGVSLTDWGDAVAGC